MVFYININIYVFYININIYVFFQIHDTLINK